ncbi:MAG: iron-containing alcohol dehydrogenase [Candidatus Latescibacterota bacterium]|jgi:glycerol-1-phosphate dehydrogenase [NAD(P)+]
MSLARPIRIDLAPLLRPWASELITRCIAIEQQAVQRSAELLTTHLPSGPWLLAADPHTWEAAGEAVWCGLIGAGVALTHHPIEPDPGKADPVADDARIDALTERLRQGRFTAAVAVGSGTVNDVVKLAADRAGIPYATVATAPSMNGYTSSLAAPLSRGVKTTVPCRPPVVCLVDLEVIARAPYRMIASGLGDLMSKPVSNADWRLAYRVLGAPYATRVMELIEAGAALLDGVPERLPQRDPEAVGKLAASLCVSGLAMGIAGSSAPSSGGEHLISHYLDMTHFALGEPHDLHGCQVGVATVSTAALYECLAAWSPADLDLEARLAAHPTWDEYARAVQSRFGPLTEAVLEHARQGHPTREELARRLHLLVEEWPSILADVRQTLRPAAELVAELTLAGCPATFGEINVTPERARRALRYSKDIRARYTILHLAADLGLLERWSDLTLATCHRMG